MFGTDVKEKLLSNSEVNKMGAKFRAFISYQHESAVLAKKIYNSLKADGISAFLDEYSIEVGQSIPKAIRNALEGCEYLICLVTNAWIESEYCDLELDSIIMEGSKNGNRTIIPLIVEKDIDIPLDIKRLKFIDFSDWENDFIICMTLLIKTISSSIDFYEIQKERVLNSSVLPWLPMNCVSFDYIWPELFVDSEIICYNHYKKTTISKWISGFRFNSNVLVIGNPGVGKSTLLKYIVTNYACDNKIVYFTAKELVENVKDINVYFLQNIFSIMYPYETSNMDICEINSILIDGIDEIGANSLEKVFAICKVLNKINIHVIITVREDFYYRFINSNHQRIAYFYEILGVQEWSNVQGLEFIKKFTEKAGDLAIYNRIKELLRKNECVESMIRNPFKASLLLFLFSDSFFCPKNDLSNVYALYEEFYEHWLLQEKNKGTSKLPTEFIINLHKKIALELYEKSSSISLNLMYLCECYERQEILDDTGITGILLISNKFELVIEKFQHETLAEFLIAKAIVESFISGGNSILDIMNIVYNNSVNVFVRSYFDILSTQKLIKITENLNSVYQDLLENKFEIPLTLNERIREQILYYVGRVPLKSIPKILEFAYYNEINSILQRAAALSLILSGDEKIEREYLEKVLNDEYFNIENRSIQLVYFGDVDSDLHSYRDEYNVSWMRTKKALLERFEQNSLRDKRLRLWDIITFKSFVISRGIGDIDKKDIKIIANCQIDFSENSIDRYELLKREKSDLLKLLKQSEEM